MSEHAVMRRFLTTMIISSPKAVWSLYSFVPPKTGRPLGWDVDCNEQEEMSGHHHLALAAEFRAKGANVLLGPAINVHRVASGGRILHQAQTR